MTISRLLGALSLALALAAPIAAKAEPALFQPWIDGTSASEPKMQVQRYDANTYVIRQSIRTNFEGPFLYLLFGHDRALLLDTGAGGLQIRPTIDQVIADWSAAHHRTTPIPLVVAHSHSHGDHHQGDVEFKDRPDTVVVGLYPKDVADFFKIADWPNQVVQYDLGGRVLDIIPTPGHQAAHIMVFDEKTRILLSGDALGPYRLYFPVNQFQTYRQGIDRIAAFAKDRHVSWILGAHIEMTRVPGELITDEAPSHPNERALELPYAALPELQTALQAMDDKPVQQAHHDFVIFPLPARDPAPFAPPPPAAAASK